MKEETQSPIRNETNVSMWKVTFVPNPYRCIAPLEEHGNRRKSCRYVAFPFWEFLAIHLLNAVIVR